MGLTPFWSQSLAGQSMNCSFNHFHVGFKTGSGRLPLGQFRLCYDIWCFRISNCKYVLLLVQVFAIDLFKCGVFAHNASCVLWGTGFTSQRSVQPVRNRLNRGLSTANTYEHHHCVCHATLFSFQA